MGGVAPARARMCKFSQLNYAPTAKCRRKDNTMSNNELILSTANAPAKFSFKNAKLNELSAKIAEQTANMNSVYNAAKEGAEAVNKALAPLFGELLSTKCYTEDGFKSVADYAEQTFGMGKSMAYMLARVGKEYHNEGGELTAKAVETLSTAKLAELTGVDRVAVSKAIDSGELTADSSLADCRAFAASHRKPGKERVVPTFTLHVYPEDSYRGAIAENVIKEDMYEAAAAHLVFEGVVENAAEVFFATAKLDGDKASAAQHFIAYTATGYTIMFEYRPYVKPAAKKAAKQAVPDIGAMSDDDFAAYIKSLKALRTERGKEA